MVNLLMHPLTNSVVNNSLPSLSDIMILVAEKGFMIMEANLSPFGVTFLLYFRK